MADARGRTPECLPFCLGGWHEDECPLVTAAGDGKQARCGATFDHDWHAFQGDTRLHVCDGVPRMTTSRGTRRTEPDKETDRD